mgnify:CR=1 FL=1
MGAARWAIGRALGKGERAEEEQLSRVQRRIDSLILQRIRLRLLRMRSTSRASGPRRTGEHYRRETSAGSEGEQLAGVRRNISFHASCPSSFSASS